MIALVFLFRRLGRMLRIGWHDAEFRALLYLVSVMIGTGTWVYTVTERWSIVDSFYFSVITLTTVGYGDLSPTRTVSKLFTIAFVLIGIGLLVAFIERIAAFAKDDRMRRTET